MYPVELVKTVQKLREQYPRCGKDKLVVMLAEGGFQVSASTVGRIINTLKARGLLNESLTKPYIGPQKAQETSLCSEEAR